MRTGSSSFNVPGSPGETFPSLTDPLVAPTGEVTLDALKEALLRVESHVTDLERDRLRAMFLRACEMCTRRKLAASGGDSVRYMVETVRVP